MVARLIIRPVVKIGLFVLALTLLAACAVVSNPAQPMKIALLAPFEGRYREVGYDAYYAAQLALSDSGYENISLLAVDDGGSPELAKIHAKAIENNTKVMAVIILGYAATDDTVLDAFADLPVLVVGDWGIRPLTDHVFILSNERSLEQLTVTARSEITDLAQTSGELVGGEMLALKEFALLRSDLGDVTVLSGAQLPDTELAQRIQTAFPFADTPGLFSTLTYDVVGLLAQSIESTPERSALGNVIKQADYSGINGRIRFDNGYWLEMPINRYKYDPDGELYQIP